MQLPAPPRTSMPPHAQRSADGSAPSCKGMVLSIPMPVLPGSASRISVDFPGHLQLNGPLQSSGCAHPAPRPSSPYLSCESAPSVAATAATTPTGQPRLPHGTPSCVAKSIANTTCDKRPYCGASQLRAHRNLRASVDAAAGAQELDSCRASLSAPLLQQSCPTVTTADAPTAAAAAAGATQSSAENGFSPFFARPSPAPSQNNEWSFGEDMARARMQARYSALTACEEIRYDMCSSPTDPATPVSSLSRRDEQQRGGGGPRWVSRLIAALAPWGAGGRVRCAGHRLGSIGRVSRRQSTGAASSFLGSPLPWRSKSAGGESELDEPMPVLQSRDSRIIHRARLGIDGRPHNVPVHLRATALAAARRASKGAAAPSAQAPSKLDAVDEAVIAAAAAFAAADGLVTAGGTSSTLEGIDVGSQAGKVGIEALKSDAAVALLAALEGPGSCRHSSGDTTAWGARGGAATEQGRRATTPCLANEPPPQAGCSGSLHPQPTEVNGSQGARCLGSSHKGPPSSARLYQLQDKGAVLPQPASLSAPVTRSGGQGLSLGASTSESGSRSLAYAAATTSKQLAVAGCASVLPA